MTDEERDKIIYYYRNGFSGKAIAEKTGLSITQVRYRLQQIRKTQKLLRWWEE